MLTKNTRPPGAPSLPLGLEGERSLVSYLLSLLHTWLEQYGAWGLENAVHQPLPTQESPWSSAQSPPHSVLPLPPESPLRSQNEGWGNGRVAIQQKGQSDHVWIISGFTLALLPPSSSVSVGVKTDRGECDSTPVYQWKIYTYIKL